jgi:hypothetical protein
MDEFSNEVTFENEIEEKVKLWNIPLLIISILMYLASLITLFAFSVNLIDFITQIISLKEQMGGTLEGITFSVIVSSLSSVVIPMLSFGFILLGVGTLILIKARRKI